MTDPSPRPPLQKLIWDGSVALEVRLAKSDCRTYDQSDPYLVRENMCFAKAETHSTKLF